MQIEQIALGGTYQLQAREVGNPLVVVERIDFHHQGQYGSLTQELHRPTYREGRAHYLVYVYEAARNTRYPCEAKALRPVT